MKETLEEIVARGRAAAENNFALGATVPCLGQVRPGDVCGKLVSSYSRLCEECAERLANENRLERSCATIPEAHRWARFGIASLERRVQRAKAIDEARAARDTHYVTLTGPAGTGKTSLSCAMMRARVEAVPARSALFLSAMRLGIARSRSEDSEPALVARAMAVDLLLLDDVGNECDMPSNPIKDVVWRRWEEHRATWITTGVPVEAIAARYGDGMARRLFERMIIDCGSS